MAFRYITVGILFWYGTITEFIFVYKLEKVDNLSQKQESNW